MIARAWQQLSGSSVRYLAFLDLFLCVVETDYHDSLALSLCGVWCPLLIITSLRFAPARASPIPYKQNAEEQQTQ